MKIEIKDWRDQRIIWSGEAESIKNALNKAFKEKAYLTRADLTEADLTEADLTEADLTEADLTGADLTGADLTGADLTRADLTRANLTRADLTRADLTRANLSEANLSGVKNAELPMAQTKILPDEGDVIGWKLAWHPARNKKVMVKLLIPDKARRSNAAARKCRCEYAKVLAVEGADYAISGHDSSCEYHPGKTIKCHEWDENRWNECSGGIHFFITRIEAENYDG